MNSGSTKQLYKDSSFHEYYKVKYKQVEPTNIRFVEQLGQITNIGETGDIDGQNCALARFESSAPLFTFE